MKRLHQRQLAKNLGESDCCCASISWTTQKTMDAFIGAVPTCRGCGEIVVAKIPLTAEIVSKDDGDISVVARCLDDDICDRSDHVSGWIFDSKETELANRLARAINAGVAITIEGFKISNGSRSYLQTSHLWGKYLKRDLPRLGF